MFTPKKVNVKNMFEIDEATARKMIKTAEETRVNTFPERNKGYVVSALTKKGNIYPGISYGSDTETLTMHSEMTALAHAAIHGEFEIIAITGPNCHICKQLIYENGLRSGIDIMIICEDDGKIKQFPISSVMPYPWPEKPRT